MLNFLSMKGKAPSSFYTKQELWQSCRLPLFLPLHLQLQGRCQFTQLKSFSCLEKASVFPSTRVPARGMSSMYWAPDFLVVCASVESHIFYSPLPLSLILSSFFFFFPQSFFLLFYTHGTLNWKFLVRWGKWEPFCETLCGDRVSLFNFKETCVRVNTIYNTDTTLPVNS